MENIVEQLLVQITENLIKMDKKISNIEASLKTVEGQTRLALDKLESLEGSTAQFGDLFGELSEENGGISSLLSRVPEMMQQTGGRNMADLMKDLTDKMGQINSRIGPKSHL